MPLIRRGDEAKTPSDGGAWEPRLRAATPDERWDAARALSGQPQAVKALGEALALEQDARVREAMLTALARVGTEESAEVIAPYIRSDDAGLRTGALDALRLMPDGLENLLAKLLADPDADVRILVCDLARQLPGPAATRCLCTLLDGELEPNVCAAAVDVLAELGAPEALPTLAQCAERFASIPFLAFAIRIAGDRIRTQASDRDG